MDVIALHAVGITNAVATLGTAITAEQARMMGRYTKRVIISYDADEAGQKAAARALKLLEEVGLEVSVLSVPGAKDPDEYIKTYGVEKFKEVIGGAKSKFQYNLDSVLSRYDINLPQDKINALHDLEKIISSVYSEAERDVYIQIVSKKLGISPQAISADVSRIIAKNMAQYKRDEEKRVKQDSVGYSDKVNPDFIKAPAIAKNEESVLGLLLLYPEHRKRVFDGGMLDEDDFYTDLNRRIFAFVKDSYFNNDNEILDMHQFFNGDEIGRLTKIKIARRELTDNGDGVLLECIDILKKSLSKKTSENTNTLDGLNALLNRKRQG